jgi:hypothetical protein
MTQTHCNTRSWLLTASPCCPCHPGTCSGGSCEDCRNRQRECHHPSSGRKMRHAPCTPRASSVCNRQPHLALLQQLAPTCMPYMTCQVRLPLGLPVESAPCEGLQLCLDLQNCPKQIQQIIFCYIPLCHTNNAQAYWTRTTCPTAFESRDCAWHTCRSPGLWIHPPLRICERIEQGVMLRRVCHVSDKPGLHGDSVEHFDRALLPVRLTNCNSH